MHSGKNSSNNSSRALLEGKPSPHVLCPAVLLILNTSIYIRLLNSLLYRTGHLRRNRKADPRLVSSFPLFLFENVGVFYTNFSITIPEFIIIILAIRQSMCTHSTSHDFQLGSLLVTPKEENDGNKF